MICWDLFKQEQKEKNRFERHRSECDPQTQPYVGCVALAGPRKRPRWARPDWGRQHRQRRRHPMGKAIAGMLRRCRRRIWCGEGEAVLHDGEKRKRRGSHRLHVEAQRKWRRVALDRVFRHQHGAMVAGVRRGSSRRASTAQRFSSRRRRSRKAQAPAQRSFGGSMAMGE
jgi:hypothetical protein